MFGIDDLVSAGLKVLDKVIPDPKAKAEAQQKLLELQQNGELKLEEFDIKREEIAANDRNSARQREMAVKDKTPAILAGIITLGYFCVLGYAMKYGMPDNGKDALLILFGALSTAWTGIIAYYFGSSSGSKNKDAIIHGMSNK